MLLFILFLAVILILLLFKIALQIKIEYNSENTDYYVTLLWLYPLTKAFITINHSSILLNLYLFKKLIVQKTLRKKQHKHSGLELVQLADPRDVHVNIDYGFCDPFTTGIACGAINVASQFINIDYLKQKPNFMAMNDYIYLDATASVNLGTTILKMIR